MQVLVREAELRNAHLWKPTKFVKENGHWRGSRDSQYLAPSSRVNADLIVQAYERAIHRYARGRLVDLGCGKAPLYGLYKEHVSEVTCVDWPSGLHGDDFIDHHMDLNGSLSIVDSAYDTIILSDVLEHIRNPGVLWSELTRICRPGGHIILGTPFLYTIHEAPHDYFRHTEFSLRAACEEHGLTVVELEAYGGGPEVVVTLLGKTSPRWARRLGLTGSIAQWILGLQPIRVLSQKTRAQLPLGYLLVASKR